MPSSPRTSPVLIGRGPELATVSARIGLDGTPAEAVLLAGDAGVGKTRLITELQAQALDAGWRVLVGHCVDFGGDALPYLPFGEAFGRLAGQDPGLAGELVAAAPVLARLLPGRDSGTRESRPVAAAARPELFEAVRTALHRLTSTAPVLLVLEDVHWADPSTRQLLSYLLSRESEPGPAILASYRTDDLHRRHPLRADVAQWSRLRGVSRVHLAPLPDAAVRDLVGALQPGDLPAAAVEGIVARAEGNPFFTEELVAAAQRGEAVPSSDLADLMLLNLEQLDDGVRTVVRAMSVSGRRVSHALLARVVGQDGPDLDAALRPAIDHHLLVADGPEGYAFRHALLAEAVYDDLLPGERVRWHRVYADALASGAVPGTAAELARHAQAAHDLTTAITASIRAGDEAMTVGGPDEATRHYELALELLADHRTAGAPAADVVEVALRANTSAIAAGSLHRALALVQDQLAVLPAAADPLQRVRLLHASASTALLDDAPIDPLQLTTEALRLVPATPSVLRARVLEAHARANASRGRNDEAARWAAEAVELARGLGLPAVVADATTTLARLTRDPAPEAAEQALRASMADAHAAGDAAAELRSMHSLGGLLYELGRLDEALETYRRSAARAAVLRRPWAPYGLDSRSMAGLVTYVRGDWDGVRRLLDTAGESPPPLARAVLDAVGLAVSAGRGEVRSLDALPSLRSWWDRDGFIAIICGTAAIDLHGDAGRLDAAVAVHDDVVALVGSLWEQPLFPARIRLSGLLLGQLATAAGQAGAHERVRLGARGAELRDAGVRAAGLGSRRGPESEAWLARVEAEYLRLRWLTEDAEVDRDALIEGWAVAVERFDRYGHVFETARSRARLAAALRAGGRPADARAQASMAAEAAEALGARPLLRELDLGADRVDRQHPVDGQLTAREQEVLALVAQGRSNREIGRLLFISGKTVSVHVSNILAKLQAAGRTEAVAVATRRGLLPTSPRL